METDTPISPGDRGSTLEVVRLFCRLGLTAFGGPAVHIAMMEDEVVERRRWMSRQHFLDLVGATSLIPGPNSTEMALHVGYERSGWRGLLGAGLAFLLPAVGLTLLFAWAYVRFGTLPGFGPVLEGIQAAVLAVILGAAWKLGRKALGSPAAWLPAVLAAGASALGLDLLITLFGSTLIGGLWLMAVGTDGRRSGPGRRGGPGSGGPAMALVTGAGLGTVSAAGPASGTAAAAGLWQLALFFLKMGAVLYGSGYLLVAFIEQGLVRDLGWLSQQQLLDAIAIGQLTPGPVLSSAAFIGYLVLGLPGGLVAAAAIFLPSFVFVVALNPLIPRLRRSPWTRCFLDAVNAVALALMAVVWFRLAWDLGQRPAGLAIALGATLALFRFHVASPWIVLGGALAGYALALAGL